MLVLLHTRCNSSSPNTTVASARCVGFKRTYPRPTKPEPSSSPDSSSRPSSLLLDDKRADALVFTALRGGPLRLNNFRRRVFTPAAERIGKPDLVPHGLIDTVAPLAISSGASIKAVRRMLGHASAKMTLDVYGSLLEKDLEPLADRIEAIRQPLAPAEAIPQSGRHRNWPTPKWWSRRWRPLGPISLGEGHLKRSDPPGGRHESCST